MKHLCSYALFASLLVLSSCEYYRGYIVSRYSDGQTVTNYLSRPYEVRETVKYDMRFNSAAGVIERADSLLRAGSDNAVEVAIDANVYAPISKAVAIKIDDKYPRFNSDLAAKLWQMWRRAEAFTQNDFEKAIDLCSVAYDYLNMEYESILQHGYSEKKRRDCLADLDNGKGSEIINFCSIFSRRLKTSGGNGELSNDNIARLNTMIDKKQRNRDLLDLVTAP